MITMSDPVAILAVIVGVDTLAVTALAFRVARLRRSARPKAHLFLIEGNETARRRYRPGGPIDGPRS